MRIIWVIFVLIYACAPRAQNMALDTVDCIECNIPHLYKNGVTIKTITFSALIQQNMSELALSKEKIFVALRDSLLRYNLISTNKLSSPYFLNIEIIDVLQPRIGFTMTARIVIRYKMYRSNDGQLVHEKRIESRATRKFSDSILVLERSRLSLEGAIRNNFKGFISSF